LAGELYEILFGSVPRAFQKSRLILSADGVLHLLPFEALRDSNGKLLIQSRVVSYTPSASVLYALRNQRPQVPTPFRWLAIGDVDYRFKGLPLAATHNALAAAILRGLATLSGSQLGNLPASRDEVVSVGRILGGDGRLLLGRDA